MNTVSNIRIAGECVYNLSLPLTSPLEHAWRMIARDHRAVFGHEASVGTEASIVIRYAQ